MSLAVPTTRAANGPTPAAAAALYPGEVMHARLKPVGHRFAYRVFSLLIDLDRLDEAGRLSPLFSVDRFNLVSFHQKDFGAKDGRLRAWVDQRFADAGLAERPARVLVLAYPRLLGTVFNPLTVFWAYDAGGRLSGVLYEVRNTFGEKHVYVAPVRDGQMGPEGLRQDQAKLFYVSPFMDMGMHYHFRLLPPGDGVRVRILETDADGPVLAATFVGALKPLTTRSLAARLAAVPALTLQVLGGIHYEAAKLWFKGVRFFHRPVHPGPVTVQHLAAAASPAGGERPLPAE